MPDDVAMATADAGALVPVHEPALVLTDPRAFASFYDTIAMEARGLKADVQTRRGRDAIAQRWRQVARTKTAIDDAGKKLTEDARTRIATVDAARRAIPDPARCPARRGPRAAERVGGSGGSRLARVDATLTRIRDAARVTMEDTSETIGARLGELEALALAEDEFQGDRAGATTDRDNAVDTLRTALQQAQRREAEQVELGAAPGRRGSPAGGRNCGCPRKRKARRMEEEARRQEAERQERERAAAEQSERERQEQVQRAAREAEERARRDAEAAARAAQEERERQHQEEVARERRAREEAEPQPGGKRSAARTRSAHARRPPAASRRKPPAVPPTASTAAPLCAPPRRR